LLRRLPGVATRARSNGACIDLHTRRRHPRCRARLPERREARPRLVLFG
jgi:hypothetical protein